MDSASKRTFYFPGKIPLFTGLVLLLCGASFLLHHFQPGASPAWLGDWGYLDIWQIYYERRVWGLLTSTLVHQDFLHLFFNMYWIWLLGKVLEEELGSWNALLFWVASGAISSAAQLAFGEGTGIGASGVVYAIFGYEWAARHQVERFSKVLDSRTIRLFVIWLFICVGLSWSEVMAVGNAAHFSGFCFGYALGYLVVVRAQLRLAWGATAVLVMLSMASAFYAPWASWWCAAQGYHCLEKDPAAAVSWLGRVDPKSEVYPQLVSAKVEARRRMGDEAGGLAEMEDAMQANLLLSQRGRFLNDLGWAYATNRDSKLRDGKKAMAYAKEACDLTEWKNASYLDTYAAANAEARIFDEAVKWQAAAIALEKKAEKPEGLEEMETRLGLYRKKKSYILESVTR